MPCSAELELAGASRVLVLERQVMALVESQGPESVKRVLLWVRSACWLDWGLVL